MKYSAKMNLFLCFVTPMKLNCNAWHRRGTKMLQFRLDNSSSKYSSISPYLVSPAGKADFYSSRHTFREILSLTIYVNEHFRPPTSRSVLARRQPGHHSRL